MVENREPYKYNQAVQRMMRVHICPFEYRIPFRVERELTHFVIQC